MRPLHLARTFSIVALITLAGCYVPTRVIDSPAVEGRVLTADGNPLAGATITVSTTRFADRYPPEPYVRQATLITDTDGRFRFPGHGHLGLDLIPADPIKKRRHFLRHPRAEEKRNYGGVAKQDILIRSLSAL